MRQPGSRHDVDEHVLQSCKSDTVPEEPVTNEEWRVWGDVDPMFGVAAWSGRRQFDANPWTIEEFQALGQRDWRDFWALWQRWCPVENDSVMEIGCGAGRMSNALAP